MAFLGEKIKKPWIASFHLPMACFLIRTFGLGHLGQWADPSKIIIKPPAKILGNQGSVHRIFFPEDLNHSNTGIIPCQGKFFLKFSNPVVIPNSIGAGFKSASTPNFELHYSGPFLTPNLSIR
jgi:hypothetical protein